MIQDSLLGILSLIGLAIVATTPIWSGSVNPACERESRGGIYAKLNCVR